MEISLEEGLIAENTGDTYIPASSYISRLKDYLRQSVLPNKQKVIAGIGGLAFIMGAFFVGVHNIYNTDNFKSTPVSDLLFKTDSFYPGQVEHTHRPFGGQYIFK